MIRCLFRAICQTCCIVGCAVAGHAADDPPAIVLPLIEQTPFDRLTLKGEEDADQRVLRLVPFEIDPRRPLQRGADEERLRIRLFDRPDQAYEVAWEDIERVELFEELILAAAADFVRQKRFDDAYRYLQFVEGRDAAFPGLAALWQRCLYFEAAHWHETGRDDQALALLDELYGRNPAYENLERALTEIVDAQVAVHLAAGNRFAARRLVESLADKFPENAAVRTRSQELIAAASAALDDARAALARDDLRAAYDGASQAVDWWPSIDGGAALLTEVRTRYPVVFVGVEDSRDATADEPLARWAWLRRAPLLARFAVEPATADAADQRYISALGAWQVEGDELRFTIDEAAHWPAGEPITAFDLARWLSLGRSTPPLAALAGSGPVPEAVVAGPRELRVHLAGPLLRPEALLAAPLLPWHSAPRADASQFGPYEMLERRGDELRLRLREGEFTAVAGQPAEIVERRLPDAAQALGPLAAGAISAVDRLPPWDVAAFRRSPSVRVERYARPTLHLLVPNPRSRRLRDALVRRALLSGLDRSRIVRELTGGDDAALGQPIALPLPAELTAASAAPDPFDPQFMLAALAQAGASGGQALPWRLAHPPSAVGRRACRAIQTHWGLGGAGLAVEVVEAADAATAAGADLWYVEWPVVDPLWDLAALVGPAGLAPADAGVTARLAELLRSDSPQSAAERLASLQEALHASLPVLPLWQLSEHCAFHASLTGVEPEPSTCYQHVRQWRLAAEAAP
jgi:ABC-type transport system substrate-binding protein